MEEAYNLGCDRDLAASCKNSPASAPSWIYETSYWLGSASNSTKIWGIRTDGAFGSWTYDNYGYSDIDFGVRPVIVI